jgi:hypothetical protein
MSNRFAYVIAVIVATFLLIGCQTAQVVKNPDGGTTSANTDSSKDTRTVKGINGWEGWITGTPAPDSKFTKLEIGMGIKQVTDIVGQPTDQGSYMTGKAWIPFYFGSDRHRTELVYKGQGRLIFAGGAMGDFSSGNLIGIIHNAQESGYR